MKNLLSLLLVCYACFSQAQVINLTPQAASILINTNTSIPMGGNFKTYIVCSGNVLTYQESSTMDTIILMPGAVLKIDSTFSYGYSNIYAKAGSTVDINFKQVGSLKYEAGVTILDTNVAPPSFFMGSAQVTGINVSYANLPGGSGCIATVLSPDNGAHTPLSIYNNGETLHIRSGSTQQCDYMLVNTMGARVEQWSSKLASDVCDISMLPAGIYFLRWKIARDAGVASFSK